VISGTKEKKEMKKRIEKLKDLIEEGKLKTVGKVKREWKHYASQFGMTYITWKERKSNGILFKKTELEKLKTS